MRYTRFLNHHVTIPIFYVNSDPHIGHLYSAVLADAFFRWKLLRDGNTSTATLSNSKNYLFTAGTDEHGKKIQDAAFQSGLSPQKHCDAYSEKFQFLFQKFAISNTAFVRTSSREHAEAVIHFWRRLRDLGYIYKSNYEGWYSIVDECFYSDFEVTDGIHRDGKPGKISIETQSAVSRITEENYSFDLTKFYDRIRHWITRPGVLMPTHFLQHIDLFMEHKSTGQLSISRPTTRCSWGISVPDDPSQTIYVWLDALVNYLTAAGYPNLSHNLWPPTIQILGKDILKFHAIYWPAFLLAADLPLPKQLFVHSHWLMDKRKMSKSLGNVVCPFNAADLLTVDGLRYFLLKQNAFEDGNFTMSKSVEVVNAYLVNDLGNLLQRAINPKLNPMQQYPLGYELQDLCSDEAHGNDAAIATLTARQLVQTLEELPECIFTYYDNKEIHNALDTLVDVIQLANRFFQYQQPWKLTSQDKINSILFLAYESVRMTAILLQPVTPGYSEKLLSILGIPPSFQTLANVNFNLTNNFPSVKVAGSLKNECHLLNGWTRGPIFPRINFNAVESH